MPLHGCPGGGQDERVAPSNRGDQARGSFGARLLDLKSIGVIEFGDFG
jgi:hypothetical protein